MNDAADVVVLAENATLPSSVSRVDAIDVALAVRSVLGHRHPNVLAVVVDAARVILRPVGQLDLAEQLAVGVELEEPAATDTGERSIEKS